MWLVTSWIMWLMIILHAEENINLMWWIDSWSTDEYIMIRHRWIICRCFLTILLSSSADSGTRSLSLLSTTKIRPCRGQRSHSYTQSLLYVLVLCSWRWFGRRQVPANFSRHVQDQVPAPDRTNRLGGKEVSSGLHSGSVPVCSGSSVSIEVGSCPDHRRPRPWNRCSYTRQSPR